MFFKTSPQRKAVMFFKTSPQRKAVMFFKNITAKKKPGASGRRAEYHHHHHRFFRGDAALTRLMLPSCRSGGLICRLSGGTRSQGQAAEWPSA
jgi:hypothetical protein